MKKTKKKQPKKIFNSPIVPTREMEELSFAIRTSTDTTTITGL
jgi:hypothetical protein